MVTVVVVVVVVRYCSVVLFLWLLLTTSFFIFFGAISKVSTTLIARWSQPSLQYFQTFQAIC